MKNYILKSYILLFCLLSNFMLFATPTEDPDECPECPENPINGKIIWLAIAGIAFALYFFNRKRVKTV